MKNEQHGPFEIRCWCDHFAEYHCAIQHVPLGISVEQKSYGFGAAEEAAWKEMAMRLSEKLQASGTAVQMLPNGNVEAVSSLVT